MTVIFVLIVALLVLAALAVVIVPLVRTGSARAAVEPGENSERFAVLSDSMRELDMEFEAGTLERGEYEEAKMELQRQAVDADDAPRQPAARTGRTVWAPTLVVAIAMPLLAVVLYVAMGQPAAVLAGATGGAVVAQDADAPGADHVQAMIASLRQRLQEDSSDARGWTLLARAYAATGQSQEAVDAYEKAVALQPDSAGLLVEYANALGIFHDRNLSGKPQQLIKRALELQPGNLSALALAGAAAFQQGNRSAAVEYWQRLKQVLPPDSDKHGRIDALIARAEGRQPAMVDAAIHGTITVSKALREKITAGDTLFIFARAPDGPPMPLAVVRQPAPQFPLQFTLDDTHAMVSGVHLSQYPMVNIVARVSRTGNATLQPGDLEGRVQSVPVGSEHVRIVIDNRVGS